MSLLLPTDGCPACVTAERASVVHPHRVDSDGQSVYAYYRCPDCQHLWWTGWSPEAAVLPCPGCAACVPDAGAA